MDIANTGVWVGVFEPFDHWIEELVWDGGEWFPNDLVYPHVVFDRVSVYTKSGCNSGDADVMTRFKCFLEESIGDDLPGTTAPSSTLCSNNLNFRDFRFLTRGSGYQT